MGNQVKPVILKAGKYSNKGLEEFKTQNLWKIHDILESQIKEIFEIRNAHLINEPNFDKLAERYVAERTSPSFELSGNYVYYPWSGVALHMIDEDELHELRTNRTNLLITKSEQEMFGQFTAGVAGLSFGNGIALSLVYAGASNTIKIADRDIFETTNLNRVRVGLKSVNIKKTKVTAQEIYEINPYADVQIYDHGLNEDNIQEFIYGNKKLNIVFDVVDDFAMKVRIRLEAKKAKIPVVMLTSLEDSVLVDVERFDLDPEAEIFHGLLGDITDDLLNKKMTEEDKARYAMKIVGIETVSYRNLLSLSEIGQTLVSRPHLYGTVSIVCGLASYIAKRIALKEDMPSLRQFVPFHDVLGILPNSEDTPKGRQEILSKLMKG